MIIALKLDKNLYSNIMYKDKKNQAKQKICIFLLSDLTWNHPYIHIPIYNTQSYEK